MKRINKKNKKFAYNIAILQMKQYEGYADAFNKPLKKSNYHTLSSAASSLMKNPIVIKEINELDDMQREATKTVLRSKLWNITDSVNEIKAILSRSKQEARLDVALNCVKELNKIYDIKAKDDVIEEADEIITIEIVDAREVGKNEIK